MDVPGGSHTAVAGFGVGLVLSDAAATVGASGGVFGLLGMGMGHGLRHAGHAGFLNRRRRMMQLIGGAMGLLAFTAFSPESNVYAHVGGFVAGMPLGMVLPKPPPRAAVQALLGTAAAGIVTLAWILAR